jgi:hypothetical protein
MTRPNEPSVQEVQTSPNVVDLSAWARDLFKDITAMGIGGAHATVEAQNGSVAADQSTGWDEARSEFSDTLKSHSPPVDAPNITNEHPVEPATTSIPHKGEIGR